MLASSNPDVERIRMLELDHSIRQLVWQIKNSESEVCDENEICNINKQIRAEFHCAIRKGLYQSIEYLLDQGITPELKCWKYGGTALHISVEEKQKDIVELLLKFKANVNSVDSLGNTPLSLAVSGKNSNSEIVKILLKNGANANHKLHEETTVLHIAIGKKELNLKIVELLLEHGANVLLKFHHLYSPLFGAIALKSVKLVKLLLKYGANANEEMEDQCPHLCRAAAQGDLEIAKQLLNHGAEIDARHRLGVTALHLSICRNNRYMYEFLIKRGANINAETVDATILHHAIKNSWSNKCIRRLVKLGVHVDVRGKWGDTPLQMSATRGNVYTLKLFLKRGAKVSNVNACDHHVLHSGVLSDNVEVIKILLDHGAYIDSVTRKNATLTKGLTPLHLAILQGKNAEVARFLLERGANVNAAILQNEVYSGRCSTALHCAVERGRFDIAQILVEYGAKVEAKSKDGWTPLHCAVKASNKEIVELLLDHGARLDKKIEGGTRYHNYTPLHLAVVHGNLEVVRVLLEHKADMELTICDGGVGCYNPHRALHLAIGHNQPAIVQLLLNFGADYEAELATGLTPIFWAVEMNNLEIVKILMSVKPNLRTKLNNKTICDFAVHLKRDKIVQFFRKNSNKSRK